MRGGMGNLMKQAQQMQQKMMKLQEEIAKKTLDASVGGGMVTVTVNGKSEVLRIKIEPQVVDPEQAHGWPENPRSVSVDCEMRPH